MPHDGYVLNGKLALHDIHDVEAFTRRLIPRRTEPRDIEDIHAYLIATCWELSLTYQPGALTFSTYATHQLQRRITDHTRQRNGRTVWKFRTHTYTRTLPTIHSIDEPGLAYALATRTSHPQADRDPDLERLLNPRGSTKRRDTALIRRAATEHPPGRTRRAA